MKFPIGSGFLILGGIGFPRPSQNPPEHGATRLSTYMDIHRRIMSQYLMDGHFVVEDTITDVEPASEEEYGTAGFLLQGQIGCRGRIVIAVRKFLEILELLEDGDVMIETRFYRYNVRVQGMGRRRGNIFRYDNVHPGLYPGHHDPHHVHWFDFRTGDQLAGSPEWVGAYGWPRLSVVVNRARDWYLDHRDELPDPDGLPKLGTLY